MATGSNTMVIERSFSRRTALRTGGVGVAAAMLYATGWSVSEAQQATPATSASDGQAGEAPFPETEQLAMETVVATRLAETATPGALVSVWYPGRGAWTHAAGIGGPDVRR